MKIKNLSFCLFFLGIFLLFSCNKEEVRFESHQNFKVLTEYNFDQFIQKVELNFNQNMDFIEDFVHRALNDQLNKDDFKRMLSILNFNSEIDVSKLDSINHELGIYEILENRMKIIREINLQSSNYSQNRLPDDECDRLVVIRDAMLEECDNYSLIMKTVCKSSVMLAHWYHWYNKDCHK